MKTTLFLILALVLLTAAIYWPVRHFGFITYDDQAYLVDNPYIQTGINRASLHDAFTRIRFANYAPVLSISYLLDQSLFHLRPGAMHVENVLIHLTTGLLLWRVVLMATGEKLNACIVAALFLCHPTHVESVCWIADRKDLLGTLFLMPAMLCYLRYCKQHDDHTMQQSTGKILGPLLSYIFVVLFFVLSLLSKSSGATFPAVLLLLDFWPLQRWPCRSWVNLGVEKIPLILIAAVAVGISQHALRNGGGLDCVFLTPIQRINNAIVCYVIYLEKAFAPFGLAIYYPHPGDRPVVDVVASAGLLILITAIVWRFRKRMPYLLIGWLWYVGCLLPVIQLVQIGPHAMADRYSYFPSIGLSIAVVWGVGALFRQIFNQHRSSIAMGSLFVLIIAACSIIARHQVDYWKDSYTIFSHVLDVTPDSALPHEELGGLALDRNDLATAFREYGYARDIFADPGAFDGLGNCYLFVDYSKAISNYQAALKRTPQSIRYHVHLATALRLHGDLAEARKEIEVALNLDPEFVEAHEELTAIDTQSRKLGHPTSSNHS